MKSVGIIAEYNPFHNGHLYHLEKVKEMFPDYVIVLVMSSNFTQRGDISIINKWDKTKIALKYGIDLVIELPYAFASEAADYFAYAAMNILENLKVDSFVFGSESDNINDLMLLAKTEVKHPEFDSLVKINMRLGLNYPTALSNALEELTNKRVTLSNDLLGISYLKEIVKNNYKIKPYTIKRSNTFTSKTMTGKISSATAVREAIINNEDIKNQVPDYVYKYLKNTHQNDDYFKFLKYKILMEDDLDKYQTVDEGISARLKKEIVNAKSYDEFINKVKSKRYTYNRINRMLNHILCNYTKKERQEIKKLDYIRILGFNDLGRKYINSIKKDCSLPIISNFSKSRSKLLDLEFKATIAYSAVYDEEEQIKLITSEYKNNPGGYDKYD